VSPEKPQRISIGFHGGQVLSARISDEDLAGLRQALVTGSGGWHELSGEEGKLLLELGRIDYVLVDDDEHRVGF
jgi:hypothetical protein